jgi:hypothetical protein
MLRKGPQIIGTKIKLTHPRWVKRMASLIKKNEQNFCKYSWHARMIQRCNLQVKINAI